MRRRELPLRITCPGVCARRVIGLADVPFFLKRMSALDQTLLVRVMMSPGTFVAREAVIWATVETRTLAALIFKTASENKSASHVPNRSAPELLSRREKRIANPIVSIKYGRGIWKLFD